MTGNAIRVITPYWYSGIWVFNDPDVELVREPFIEGVPAMIDDLVSNIPEAREGFRLTFSETPFPGHGDFQNEEPGHPCTWRFNRPKVDSSSPGDPPARAQF